MVYQTKHAYHRAVVAPQKGAAQCVRMYIVIATLVSFGRFGKDDSTNVRSPHTGPIMFRGFRPQALALEGELDDGRFSKSEGCCFAVWFIA